MVHCCLVDNEHASDDHPYPYGDGEYVRLCPVHIDLVVVPGNLLLQLETTQDKSLKLPYDIFVLSKYPVAQFSRGTFDRIRKSNKVLYIIAKCVREWGHSSHIIM